MNRRAKKDQNTSAANRSLEQKSVGSNFKTKNAFSIGIQEHKKHFIGSLRSILNRPMSNLMTIMVIAISLTLPAVLYLLTINGANLTKSWQTSHSLSVYVNNQLSQSELNELANSIELSTGAKITEIISATQAMQELSKNSDLDLLTEALDENPLPHTIVVSPENPEAENLKNLSISISGLNNVESVQYDNEWILKLSNILRFINRMTLFLSIILAFGLVLIVGNTIRLQIQNQRNEIEVKKLIGASDRFVRRPFLYLGFWYGLLGALVAWILLLVFQFLSYSPLKNLLDIYASQHQLSGFGIKESFSLLAIGSILALLGAWMTANSTLRQIEP